jgi:hypothetical protein
MSKEIPRRFNAEAVARYTRIMLQVCSSWPSPVLVDPSPLSKETFRSRFRDAVKGVVVFGQGPESLRIELLPIHNDLSVSEQDGKLVIGPRALLKARQTRATNELQAGILLSGTASQADEQSAYEGPDSAVIKAIAVLIQYGFLSSAKLCGVSAEFIESHLEEDYEGGVIENEDGSLTLY